MTLTPIELRHVKLGRGLGGYNRAQADRLLDQVSASFAEVWDERAALREQVSQLEKELGARIGEKTDLELELKVEELQAEIERYREVEQSLRSALVLAQDAREGLLDGLRRELEENLEDAREEARRLIDAMLQEYRGRLLEALELGNGRPVSNGAGSLLDALEPSLHPSDQ